MQRIFSANKKKNHESTSKSNNISEEHKQYESSNYMKTTKSNHINSHIKNLTTDAFNYNQDIVVKKEYINRLSLVKINFDFDEYGLYPDDNFKPSVFFFKFFAMKIGFHSERKRKKKISSISSINIINKKLDDDEDENINKKYKLKINIPNTIILNDVDSKLWMFTDVEGYVKKKSIFNDADIINTLKGNSEDPNEIYAVSKTPIIDDRIKGNHLELLNKEELESCLSSKNSNAFVIQSFIKCKGPKAFLCRTVWRREKPPYVYILSNKTTYLDINNKLDHLRFIIDSSKTDSYHSFCAASGRHLEETLIYLNNIVKFIEAHCEIIFEELIGDFLKDEAGIWWLISIKAFKIKNINKYLNANKNNICYPNLDFFMTRNNNIKKNDNIKKFNYQTTIKCKFCGIDFTAEQLKYKLTTKMIFETDEMLKHMGIDIKITDRPDLKNTKSSMLYLPYRVCEECFLLYETSNDIKKYQIEISNIFRIPVDQINFGIDIEKKSTKKDVNTNLEEETQSNISENSVNEEEVNTKNLFYNSISQKQFLYRILICFNDILWAENINYPIDKEMYLAFFFLDNWYKVKIAKYYGELDYLNVNFNKIFHIICGETSGFINYVEKQKTMTIHIGWIDEQYKEINNNTSSKLNHNITIEDNHIFDISLLTVFATVELSLNDLKYGPKYENKLNGLLFKKDKPYFVGRLRCVFRISKEKEMDITKYKLRQHNNFYIPPVNFVISKELPFHWLEIVERQKLREKILDEILKTISKKKIKYDKSKHKEEVFKTLENLVCKYLNENKHFYK